MTCLQGASTNKEMRKGMNVYLRNPLWKVFLNIAARGGAHANGARRWRRD